LYISAASSSDSGESGGDFLSGGTKLGVVVDTTLVEVTVTTFNGVEGTKLDEVTKSDGLEL
jgi:hypothetical protein